MSTLKMAEAGASRGDMDPVLTHADALDHLVSRVISWVAAAEGLRNNIKAVAEIEKQSAARIRKLTVVPAYFLQAPQSQDNDKPTQDSVISALRGCFEFVPANMAAFHEEIASNLIQLDTKQGKELEKLALKHKAAIEAVVFTVYGRVERAREDLEAKARKLHSLMHSDDDHAEVWLAQVQQAAARRQEREASSHYCQEATTLWQKAQTFEAEISAKMQQVMALFVQCQSAAAGKLQSALEAAARDTRAVDSSADWRLFASQPRIADAHDVAVSHDWREWKSVLSEIARAEEAKGDVMCIGSEGRVLCAGYLQRQGEWIGINWKKRYFVVTREGHLYSFSSRLETKPEASFCLPSYKVEANVDPATGVLSVVMHPKSKGWFTSMSVSGPSRLAVRVDASGFTVANGLVLTEWKNAIVSFGTTGAALDGRVRDSISSPRDTISSSHWQGNGAASGAEGPPQQAQVE